MREAGDGRRVRVLVGVVVSYVGTPLLPSLGFWGRLALRVLPGSSVGVTNGLAPLTPRLLRFRFALRVLPGSGVVVTDGFTPLLPRLLRFRLALELRKSRNGGRGGILVGVIVSNVGTPLFPRFRLGGGLALELGESRDGRRGGILVGVVVSDVGTPLRPRLGFRRTLELGESWDITWGSVLVGIVVPDVGTPFRPSYGGKRKSDRDGIEGRMVEGNSHSGWGARATGTAKAWAEIAPTARVERATLENMMI